MIRLVRIYRSVENPYEKQSYIYNQTHTHEHTHTHIEKTYREVLEDVQLEVLFLASATINYLTSFLLSQETQAQKGNLRSSALKKIHVNYAYNNK